MSFKNCLFFFALIFCMICEIPQSINRFCDVYAVLAALSVLGYLGLWLKVLNSIIY